MLFTQTQRPRPNMQGFTLLELSIVIAIIGLIIGGLVVGKDMIRAAELNSVVSDIDKYKSAVQTFQLKYQSLPGDMVDATDYWGAAHADPTTCRTTASTGKETCNGNENGSIFLATGSLEPLRFWQHLANAELITGTFAGVGSNTLYSNAEIGVTTPASQIDKATWTAMTISNKAGTFMGTLHKENYGNAMYFGRENPGTLNYGKVLTPAEALNIDTKIDEGTPDAGKIYTNWNDECTNGTTQDDRGLEYLVSSDSLNCILVVKDAFK